MKLNPKLAKYSKTKYAKDFNKFLKGIEEDLASQGVRVFDVEIISKRPSRSFAARYFLGTDMTEAEEIMVVTAKAFGCPVEILVPIAAWRTTLPFVIEVQLPAQMSGRAEFRRGMFGGKWRCEPKDKQREKELKSLLPDTELKQHQTRMDYEIQVGQTLEPKSEGETLWWILSGYEGGLFSGGSRPRVKKYLEAIPAVENLLKKWHEERVALYPQSALG